MPRKKRIMILPNASGVNRNSSFETGDSVVREFRTTQGEDSTVRKFRTVGTYGKRTVAKFATVQGEDGRQF
jgi:hypothetical protein